MRKRSLDSLAKAARPIILGGVTIKVATGCGNMYVQMNWHGGKLFEVFATLGKTGGCATCQSEGITRSVTMGLRCGVPVEEYIDQLRGLRCPVPLPFPKDKAVNSCPDAISKTLAKYGVLSGVDILNVIGQAILPQEGLEPGSPEEEKEALKRIEEQKQERERKGLR